MSFLDKVHALLFVADTPAKPETLAVALGVTEGQILGALEVLGERLAKEGPIHLVTLAGGWQLATKPEYAATVGTFLKPQAGRLGKGMLEVLAIVAYRQPVTAAEIETIRGVGSDYGLRGLLERRLVVEVGRKKAPGRPMLYGTSSQFLHLFNLAALEQLPPIQEPAEQLDGGPEALLAPVN